MTLVQLAGALPRDPEFREWVSQQDKGFYCPDEFFAGDYIRQVCGMLVCQEEVMTDYSSILDERIAAFNA